MLMNTNEYLEIVDNIKSNIRSAQYKSAVAANKELIMLYWNIGKIINAHKSWGNKFIENLAQDIKLDFTDMKGFSLRNLKYMSKFAATYDDIEFVQQAVAQIPWGHNIVILDKITDDTERKWYLNQIVENGWSRNVLIHQIESDLYGRQVLSDKVSNFENRLSEPQSEFTVRTMKGHRIILNDFLNLVKKENITRILDAGSGRTSLSVIAGLFSDVPIDAVVYPGDLRKINSIKEITDHSQNISLLEKDICGDTIFGEYDIIIAHLLLGEAVKFGNTFEDLLEKIITMKYKYLIIIDYLEDPAVTESDIMKICEKNNLAVVYRSYFTNQEPQVWENFTGTHNFGYLIKRL